MLPPNYFCNRFVKSRSETKLLPIGIECIEEDRDYLSEILVERADFYDLILSHKGNLPRLFDTLVSDLSISLKGTVVTMRSRYSPILQESS